MAYVVVGASAAGINAAKTLREINKDVEIILVSKDEYVYSRCILHHFLDGRRDIEDLDFSPGEFFKKYDIKSVDYTDIEFLRKFLNEQGKILPRRLTGNSLKFQKKVAKAVKRARQLSLLPFVADNL